VRCPNSDESLRGLPQSAQEQPISPLRQRMIEDMTVRNFDEKTRNDYIRQVKTFTAFLGRSPDQAIPADATPSRETIFPEITEPS
jgi:hypothetical protein